MGYYSSVTLIATKPMAAEINKFIREEMYSQPDLITYDSKNEVTRYAWDWIKWYENDGIQKRIAELRENVIDYEAGGTQDERYKDMAFVFLRDGESDDDIEFERGNVEGTVLEDCWCRTEITYDNSQLRFDDTLKEEGEGCYV